MINEIFVDEKLLSLSALKNDYLDLEKIVRATERATFSDSKCSHCVEPFQLKNGSSSR